VGSDLAERMASDGGEERDAINPWGRSSIGSAVVLGVQLAIEF
jgi:hypothetical protein